MPIHFWPLTSSRANFSCFEKWSSSFELPTYLANNSNYMTKRIILSRFFRDVIVNRKSIKANDRETNYFQPPWTSSIPTTIENGF